MTINISIITRVMSVWKQLNYNYVPTILALLFIQQSSCSFRDLSSFQSNRANLVQYVNPLVGTASSPELSNGNTYPAVALPWGMNFWTPQTGDKNDQWIYTYNAKTIQGFRCTHQPNPWMGDYGAFNIMPIEGELIIDGASRASEFSHVDEIAKPYYYQVNLDRYDIEAEIAPTIRGAAMNFTFPESNASYILLDALPGGSYLRILPQQRRIVGYVKNNSGGVHKGFACYFVLEFDKNFLSYNVWDNNSIRALRNELTSDGNAGVAVRFATERNERIQVKIATSFISVKQAIINFNRELQKYNFDQIKIRANQIWNDELNKIEVEGGTVDQRYSFYTAFYRALLLPRIFYELDENGRMIHYSPFDTQVHEGFMFADIGFWDSFRALFPFYTILYPDRTAHMMQWLVNVYKEGAWLPIWPSPGYRKKGIGSHAASLFADAYLKGIDDFDVELAYEAMKKDAFVTPPNYAPGRDGLKWYNDKGYIPFPEFSGATSKTLEYAYDDFCVMQMAKSLNRFDDIDLFRDKSMYYKNVFDTKTNFMRGKTSEGLWHEPFDPIEWGGPYATGNAWHNNWSVIHDVQGLVELMGGQDKFIEKLDSVFLTPAEFKIGTYGKVIHEMTEMILTDMGQYSQGSQPLQHMPYLYNYGGQPWKTQEKVREIMNRLYEPTPDGLGGDENSGQISSWYLFSAMGFYPVCPGQPSYVFGSPIFKKITINLYNGNAFVLEAPENNQQNHYIERMQLNGTRISRNWITHDEIMNGGKLYLEMDNKPNKKRGTDQDDLPFSISR